MLSIFNEPQIDVIGKLSNDLAELIAKSLQNVLVLGLEVVLLDAVRHDHSTTHIRLPVDPLDAEFWPTT